MIWDSDIINLVWLKLTAEGISAFGGAILDVLGITTIKLWD
jgi:hypothetical protein